MTYLDFFPIPLDPQTTVILSVAYAVLMAGVATAFLAAEPHSPTTRAFALAYGMTGVSAAVETAFVYLYPEGTVIPWFARFPVMTTITISAYPLWLLRLAQTSQTTPQAMLWIKGCVWLQWTLAATFFVVGGIYAEERLHEFYLALGRTTPPSELAIRMFVVPNLVSTLALTLGGIILFTQRIDPAERRRALTFAVSFPFLASIFMLPAGYNLLGAFIGTLIFLLGAIRFHVMLGERGQFMSRFLSTQVAELVRRRGLAHVTQPRAIDLTVVSCNLRGFSKLSQHMKSDRIIQLLNEYYDVIGAAVAEFDATIKDYAGDGVLILVGAPLPTSDHAQRGLKLARALKQRVPSVITRWADAETPLGLGIGVTSGKVTVGAIGSALRMEYTAVGTAVNLASRLCEKAVDQEILVDATTAEFAGLDGLESRGHVQFKGLAELPLYAVASS